VAKGRASGTLIVTRFGTEPKVTESTAEPAGGEREGPARPRRRRRGGGRPADGEPRRAKPATAVIRDDDVVPLGRAIIEDVDPLDDEIPSYRRLRAARPTPVPAPVAEPRPRPVPVPA